jgi:hypothetical protein
MLFSQAVYRDTISLNGHEWHRSNAHQNVVLSVLHACMYIATMQQVNWFTKWRLNRQYAKYTTAALDVGVEYYHLSVKSIGQQLETVINPCIEAGTIAPLIDR